MSNSSRSSLGSTIRPNGSIALENPLSYASCIFFPPCKGFHMESLCVYISPPPDRGWGNPSPETNVGEKQKNTVQTTGHCPTAFNQHTHKAHIQGKVLAKKRKSCIMYLGYKLSCCVGVCAPAQAVGSSHLPAAAYGFSVSPIVFLFYYVSAPACGCLFCFQKM